MGEGGRRKENTADRGSGIAGVCGVSGRWFESREWSFFLLLVLQPPPLLPLKEQGRRILNWQPKARRRAVVSYF